MYNPIKGGTPVVVQGVTCWIPKQPPKAKISGSNLPIDKQTWKRTPLPDNWDELREEEKDIQEGDPYYVDQVLEDFRIQEWERRVNGFWFMNRGEAVYITGRYYFYLNWCKLDHPGNDGYPFYRDIDRDEFYFTEYCFQDPKCLGYIKIGPRGYGKSSKESGICLEDMTRPPHRRQAAVQSKSKEDAKIKIFKDKMVEVYKELPDFFQPESNHGSNPEAKLSFFRDAVKGKGAKRIKQDESKELKNSIYPVPAKETTLDGGTYAIIMQDEIGKCLKKDTPVLMYDGSIKMSQNIVEGDLLMGDDSTSRKVLGLGRGREMMYDVVPNKGMTWGCNESHILSLKLSSDKKIKGYNKGDTLNITVRDFLKLTKNQQKHCMLYRVAVEYPEKKHQMPPYMLGIWLGDGSARKFRISKPDIEIKEYLEDYAYLNDTQLNTYIGKDKFGKDKTPGHAFARGNKIGGLIRSLDLYCNKHIPIDYLVDSAKNRLDLLAGLLDTDGSLNQDGNKVSYEITQKSETLAADIHKLANSLGFSSTIHPKMARMKREDGSVYECEVFRVNIFGNNLHEIPLKIERKKAKEKTFIHPNTRNPLRSGFKLVPTGIDDYYGFAIDGNRLFLLGDYTVTHNTDPKEEADVHRRLEINRFCVFRDNIKRGMILATTTVEEMDKGGAECKKIWFESDFSQKSGNGFTISGLYRYFTSSLDTRVIDEYGKSHRVQAAQELEEEHKIRSNDPIALNSFMRKNPRNIDEAFIANADKCLFNAAILENSRRANFEAEMSGKPLTIKGDLDWVKEKDGDVRWIPNNKNGRWEISWLPAKEKRNQVTREWDYAKKPMFRPTNDELYAIATDPISHTEVIDDDKKSMAAAHIYRKFDYWEKDDNLHDTWVAEYYGRPDPETYGEDMIMACIFWGCSILIENNKINLINHFNQRGYRQFVMRRPQETFTESGGKAQDTQGAPSSTPTIEIYINKLISFVNRRGHTIRFNRTIGHLIEFTVKKKSQFDLAVSAGWSLVAADRPVSNKPAPPTNANTLFRQYTIQGNQSKVIKK